ncbi:helix-turn-helix transcriptional regulator [Alloyangia pacifica]|uniref:helix-turn-helix transcriptional regulator n=1 Tax=Alloyangia pacifica TaxID=311180 RepID=UPI001CFDDAC8|nr:hypothetical protein [Alloyangia pacifica]
MSDETEILAALFAASMGTSGGTSGEGAESEEGLWQHFLARLSAATLAESALLRLFWPGSPVRSWHIGPAWEGPSESVVERMRSGRVYSQVDLPGPGPGEPAGQGEDLPLRALRWRLGRGGRSEATGARVLLALRRRGEDFRAIDGLQLANLTPYLGVALGGWQQLQQARLRAALDRGLASDLGAGWLLFSPSGQVTALAEGLAERLEALAGITLRADGRLTLPEPAAQALRLALATVESGAEAPVPVLLSRAPRVELMLTREAVAGEVLLLGRLRHGLAARALPPERIRAAFGLSRSEARLAACLCDGLSLAEAAADLGWTQETARSTSKQVFARMGVSGQPGVVRRMLGSAVWLGDL